MNAGETGCVMFCARIASISLRLASSTCQPSISSSGSSCWGAVRPRSAIVGPWSRTHRTASVPRATRRETWRNTGILPDGTVSQPAHAKQTGHFVEGHRSADEVALNLVAVHQEQDLCLLLFLDAFGDHLEAQRVRERIDRLNQRPRCRIGQESDDEGPVDLECLNRQLREIPEGGVTGAEVVDGNPQAEVAHMVEFADVFLDVLHDEALGELQIDSRGSDTFLDRLCDGLNEIVLPQLNRGNVDCDAQRREALLDPAAVIECGALQRPR